MVLISLQKHILKAQIALQGHWVLLFELISLVGETWTYVYFWAVTIISKIQPQFPYIYVLQ